MIPRIYHSIQGAAMDPSLDSTTPAFLSWSGGKDAVLALQMVSRRDLASVERLVITASRQYERISHHGVRLDLIEKQADRIGLPLEVIWLPKDYSFEMYDEAVAEQYRRLRDEQMSVAVYGDIALEDIRTYRENFVADLDMDARFPLWGKPTDRLARRFVEAGFEAVVVAVNDQYLDETFVGRTFDAEFLDDLPVDVDPCGENGEFHTFVYDGPLFDSPVPFELGDRVHRTFERPGESSRADQADTDDDGCRGGAQTGTSTGGNQESAEGANGDGSADTSCPCGPESSGDPGGAWYIDLKPAGLSASDRTGDRPEK